MDIEGHVDPGGKTLEEGRRVRQRHQQGEQRPLVDEQGDLWSPERTDPVSQVVSQGQPKSAKLAAEAVVIGGQVWAPVDCRRESELSTKRCYALRFARISLARRNTPSSISSVSLPVKVFCWLT